MRKERLEELRRRAVTVEDWELIDEVDRLKAVERRQTARIDRQRRAQRGMHRSLVELRELAQLQKEQYEEEVRRSERAWLLVALYGRAIGLASRVQSYPPRQTVDYELRYTTFDRLENRISEARSLCRARFEASNDPSAVEQARVLWHELRSSPERGWDGEDYPREPELVRVVPFPIEPAP